MGYLVKKSNLLIAFIIFTIFFGGCSAKENTTSNNDSVSKPVSNAAQTQKNTGLLIGLSQNNQFKDNFSSLKGLPNAYRTLWITKTNDKTTYSEKKDSIIAPYKDSFYKVANSKFLMTDPKVGADNTNNDIYKNFSYYYNFSNIVSQAANKPLTPLFTEETFKKTKLEEGEGNIGQSYKSQTEWLWYVGSNYACVMDNNFITGGGTYRGQWSDFKMYNLNNLTSLDSRKNTVALVDLLDENEKAKLNGYSEKYNKVLTSDNKLIKSEEKIDIKNLLLTRKDGGWKVLLPLYGVYSHEGNGSSGRFVKEYITTDIKLPKTITSYDDLCIDWNTIKQKFPDAKDAVSSPNKDMLAVLTPTKLLVFNNPEKGLENPSLSIDVASNETIILNQWSNGDYVEKWDKAISAY